MWLNKFLKYSLLNFLISTQQKTTLVDFANSIRLGTNLCCTGRNNYVVTRG